MDSYSAKQNSSKIAEAEDEEVKEFEMVEVIHAKEQIWARVK